MTIMDVADLLFAARERIDFYWNFYIVVVIAIIGWLVSLKKPLTRPVKILVSVAYLIAAITNYLGLYSSYTFAEALRMDLLRMTENSPLSDTRFLLSQHSYLMQRVAAFLVHLVVGTALLIVIWFARIYEPESTTPRAAPGSTDGGGVQ